jgi:serralysin
MATVYDTEPNNNHFQANSVRLGDTIVGSLSSASDWDFYKVTLSSSGVIKLDVSTPLLSDWAYAVVLYDTSGNVLATDHFGLDNNGSVSIGASAGTYYIGVTSDNIFTSSSYTIVTSAGSGNAADYEKESNDTQATATAVALDRVITGQRSSSSDVDYFSVNTNSSGMLTVDFQAPQKYGYADYQVSIYDASGNLIDSRTGGGNMTLIDQVGAAGKYYVRIEQAKIGGYQGGDYKFVAHVDSNATLASAATLTNAVPVNGNIATVSQHNWYKVNLSAGNLYEFSVSGATSGSGTLATPSLSLCASDGHLLQYCTNLPTFSSTDGMTYTADPQIAFVAPYSGTYYLMADGLGTTGSYTVQQKTDTLSSLLPTLVNTSSTGNYLHWGSAVGSGATVTYGFMTTSSSATSDGEIGFKVMTDSQKQAVRDVLALYSAFANVTFTEVSDPNSADILYGTSNQAGVSSGVTYAGWNTSGVMSWADVYINNTASSSGGTANSDSMYAGGYGYETLIHETGHALGLKHPGDYNGESGSGTAPFIAAAWDNVEYSIMSYLDNPEYEVSAQTPALLDVAAIKYLYGARSSTSPLTLTFDANDEFAQSALAGSGPVTLDFSNQTVDNLISATPGTFSSIGLKTDGTHAHDNLALPFGTNVKTVIGGSGNDYILGGSAAMLYGGSGNDTFAGCALRVTVNGGVGTDKLELSTASAQEHVLKLRSGAVAIADASGDVALCRDVEQIQFSDTTVDTSTLAVHDNLDLALIQIYVAAFRRAPETGGYNYWLHEEATRGLTGVADVIFSLDSVKTIYPAGMSATDFVTAIYQNVFNRAPDTEGLNYWVQQLNAKSRGQLVIDMTNAALGTPDGTSGKDYFQNRVDWALYAVDYQLDKSTELTPDHLTALTTGVTADSATVVTLIGQAEAGVVI